MRKAREYEAQSQASTGGEKPKGEPSEPPIWEKEIPQTWESSPLENREEITGRIAALKARGAAIAADRTPGNAATKANILAEIAKDVDYLEGLRLKAEDLEDEQEAAAEAAKMGGQYAETLVAGIPEEITNYPQVQELAGQLGMAMAMPDGPTYGQAREQLLLALQYEFPGEFQSEPTEEKKIKLENMRVDLERDRLALEEARREARGQSGGDMPNAGEMYRRLDEQSRLRQIYAGRVPEDRRAEMNRYIEQRVAGNLTENAFAIRMGELTGESGEGDSTTEDRLGDFEKEVARFLRADEEKRSRDTYDLFSDDTLIEALDSKKPAVRGEAKAELVSRAKEEVERIKVESKVEDLTPRELEIVAGRFGLKPGDLK